MARGLKTKAFRNFAISGQDTVVAENSKDTLTLVAGTNISLATNIVDDSITISTSGLAAGEANQNAFSIVSVSGQDNVSADSSTDTLNLAAGSNVTITTDDDTDTITIAASTSGDVNQSTYSAIAVSGQSTVSASSVTDTVNFVAGSNITITTTPGTDSVTFAATGEANQNAFTTLSVSGQSDVVADAASDTLTLAEGTGITITTTPGSDTVTITTSAEANQNAFTTISVSGQTDVVADSTTDTLTLVEGSNVTITTTPAGDSVTIAATGEANQNAFTTLSVSGQTDVVADSTTDTLTLVAGSGMSITTDAASDAISIATTAEANQNAFSTIAVSGQNNVAADSTTDTLTFVAGTGISLTTDQNTDSITIVNSLDAGEANQNAFTTFSVSGQTDVAADVVEDTLTFAAGSNMTITTDAATDTITFASSGGSGGETNQNSFATASISGQSDIIADSTVDTLNFVAGQGIGLSTNASTDAIIISNTASVSVDGSGDSNELAMWNGSNSLRGDDKITWNGEVFSIDGVLSVSNIVYGAAFAASASAIQSIAVSSSGYTGHINENLLMIGYNNQTAADPDDLGIILKRGGLNNQALIWDESENEFAFVGTNSGASTSGSVNILEYSPVKAMSYMTPSSARLKENVVTIDKPIEKVKKMRGVYFDWKVTGKRDMGFIAEEVGKVLPEIVAYEDPENASGLDYPKITSLLLESVKEQQKIIENQEEKIKFLYDYLRLNKPIKS